MRTTDDPKIERLNVRMTAGDRARIERIARLRGLSISELVLDLVKREDSVVTLGHAPRLRLM